MLQGMENDLKMDYRKSPDAIFEMREGTDPLDARSYCYQVSAQIGGIFATTNHLTCNAVFGTNEILTAMVVTNTESALSLGHQSTTNGEVVTLWFWDDANSNLVKDVEETCTSIAIKPEGHEVAYEGVLSTSAFDKDRNGLMDWWEVQTGLTVRWMRMRYVMLSWPWGSDV